ncbi:hypothetical protein J4Q44_G00265270, partial [Coregonus suidteri]
MVYYHTLLIHPWVGEGDGGERETMGERGGGRQRGGETGGRGGKVKGIFYLDRIRLFRWGGERLEGFRHPVKSVEERVEGFRVSGESRERGEGWKGRRRVEGGEEGGRRRGGWKEERRVGGGEEGGRRRGGWEEERRVGGGGRGEEGEGGEEGGRR